MLENARSSLAGLATRHVALLFVSLLLANSLRLPFPGPITDTLFVIVVVVMGIALASDNIPKELSLAIGGFLGLFLVYLIWAMFDFNIQAARNIFGIAASGVVYVFCCRHGSRLLESRTVVPALAGASALSFLAYLTPTTGNDHTLSGTLAYSTMTIGIVLVMRAGSSSGRHFRGFGIFLIAAAIAIAYGHRSLAGLLLIAYPLSWSLSYVLRSRLAGISVLSAGIAGMGMLVVAVGTPAFDAPLARFDSFNKKYLGAEILSGRHILWETALDFIAERPLIGHGAGTVPVNLFTGRDVRAPGKEAGMLPFIESGALTGRSIEGRSVGILALIESGALTGRSIEGRSGESDRARGIGFLLSSLNDRVHLSQHSEILTSTHNLFLQVAVQSGLVGLVGILALCIAVLARVASGAGGRVSYLRCYVVAGTAMLILHNAFEVYLIQNVLYVGVLAWVFIGIGTAAVDEQARSGAR